VVSSIAIDTVSPTPTPAFARTAFFTGSTYASPSTPGKIDVSHVEGPSRTRTFTAPKPEGARGWSAISAEASSGTVANTQSSLRAAHAHSVDSNS
jgi:hypothetical protein